MDGFSDRGSIPLASTITHTVEHHSRNIFTVVVWRNVFVITIPIK